LNPALIDIEFSNALVPAVFIPAALAIELLPQLSAASNPDMFTIYALKAG